MNPIEEWNNHFAEQAKKAGAMTDTPARQPQECCHHDVCYQINKGKKCINDPPENPIPCIFDSRKSINFSRCATHTSPPEPEPDVISELDGLCSDIPSDIEVQKRHDAVIRKAAREQVLDELLEYGASDNCPVSPCPRNKDKTHDPWGCVKCIAESLRAQQEHPGTKGGEHR